MVDQDFWLAAQPNFVHPLIADRAGAAFFFRLGGSECEQVVFGLSLRGRGQRGNEQVQLARVEPDSRAAQAKVQLDLLVFNHDQVGFIERASQSLNTSASGYKCKDYHRRVSIGTANT